MVKPDPDPTSRLALAGIFTASTPPCMEKACATLPESNVRPPWTVPGFCPIRSSALPFPGHHPTSPEAGATQLSTAWASSGCGIANTMAAQNDLIGVAIDEQGQWHA